MNFRMSNSNDVDGDAGGGGSVGGHSFLSFEKVSISCSPKQFFK